LSPLDRDAGVIQELDRNLLGDLCLQGQKMTERDGREESNFQGAHFVNSYTRITITYGSTGLFKRPQNPDTAYE
jgi:hypothetical protein